MTLNNLLSKPWVQLVLVFVLALTVVLQTTAPTIYYLADSTEYALGAKTLGIVHAPGYSLYLLIAHLFTYLPVGDTGYRVNLLSSLSLALAAMFTYAMLTAYLTDNRVIALGATLSVFWSFHVWLNGVAAEVYMPQLAALAACGWSLVVLYRGERRPLWRVLLTGGLFGFAVALNPTSVMFAPGLALVFLMLRLPLWQDVVAGVLAIAIVLASLVYFPVRYSMGAPYNVAGEYNADAELELIDLTTVEGMYWLLSGQQFESLFFEEGVVPSVGQLREMVALFFGNFLYFGALLAVGGLYFMGEQNWRVLAVWLVFFLPYTWFFSTYGAGDKDTMLNPVMWLLAVPIAHSMVWAAADSNVWVRGAIALVLPVVMLGYNFRIVDASDTFYMRERAQFITESMPESAVVYGSWIDTTMVQYMQLVEGRRDDVDTVNLYYFGNDAFLDHVAALPADTGRPLVLNSNVNARTLATLEEFYDLEPVPLDAETIERLQIEYVPQVLRKKAP
ncbi:MAG: DUF2723 domain-containing protein [Chloroflexota bacterium]